MTDGVAASYARRTVAFAIDTLLLLMLPVLGFIVAVRLGTHATIVFLYLVMVYGWFFWLLGFWLVYGVLMLRFFSATVGMMVMGIGVSAVAASSGTGLSWKCILARCGVFVVLFIPTPLPWLLGVFMPLFDPERQAWHDKIAGTKVIRVGPRAVPATSGDRTAL